MPARPRSSQHRPSTAGGRVLSPVLLLGAGTGEATCGILYLASYLRRQGVEAFVRLCDDDESEEAMARSLGGLLAHVRPRLVGVSLKWFHHLARARQLAQALRRIDPDLVIAFGGNTASRFWRELIAWECADHVVRGDGEVPLLALCRGLASPPNVVSRAEGAAGAEARRAPLAYVQGASTDDVYYSHFDELFLSHLDLHSFSGWVAPGKGCGENCVYCGGGRGAQKAAFGRARPFLRPEASVRRDHEEIAPRTWQLRYDFAGSSAQFLSRTWAGLDLSRHSTTYFLWGVPPCELVEVLAETFHRVFMVLDIGCFSELQRHDLMRRGLLKPCPTNRELLDVIERCGRHPNLQLEISGIAGLPFASEATLEQERRLVEQVLALGCAVGYQRLEAQPGALVTEHPGRFGMVTEARTFDEFLAFFVQRELEGAGGVPMVRFQDAPLEKAVRRATEHVEALVRRQTASERRVSIHGRTRLVDASTARRELSLGDWLGAYRVPPRVAQEPVTVVRSVDGHGLACAPALSPRRFSDPSLQQGAAGAALLQVLAAFARATTVDSALVRLRAQEDLDAGSALEVIQFLAAGQFLKPT